MKKVMLLPGLLSVILMCSCSTDSHENIIPLTQDDRELLKTTAAAPTLVANQSNPFDTAGADYIRVLSAYQSGTYNPDSLSTISTILNTIGVPGSLWQWDTATGAFMEDITTSPENELVNMLNQSDLSPDAKVLLSGFVTGFEKLSQKPFEEIYAEIVALENDVLQASALSARDRQVILTVTSIARYSKSKKCCEDTDWKTSVGNVVASLAGALESSNQAIRYGLLARIGEFENIL